MKDTDVWLIIILIIGHIMFTTPANVAWENFNSWFIYKATGSSQ